MEYGFVSLCNSNDKVLSNLLKKSNNIDFLGLRKMNVRLSNIMFPFANTLMPNLVYFYYLHAIYYAVLGEGEEENRKPTKDQIERINRIEEVISKSIRDMKEATGKGFFGDVKARAYGKYKNSMKLLHFFESGWIPTFGTDMQKNIWKKNSGTLHQILTETNRFGFVGELAKKNETEWESQIKDIKNNQDNQWLCKLEPEEKFDFICRVIDPYGPEKGTITSYSVFSNIIMYYCHIKNKPSQVNRYKKIKEIEKEKTASSEISFYELQKLLEGVEDGSGNTYSKVSQLIVYKVALEYSKLQYIAKLIYNMCLFDKNQEKKNEYKKELKSKIEEYFSKYNSCSSIKVSDNRMPNDFDRVFYNNDDEGLKSAFRFIMNISKAIRNKTADVNNISDEVFDEIIDEISVLVKEREREILGGNSRLDSDIVFDEMGHYIDTFRWEYRPEEEKLEASESGDKEVIEDCKNNQDNGINGNHNMCARYYIYELFFES